MKEIIINTQEIEHCISRCLMNKEEYPEKSGYFKQQIHKLEQLLKTIRNEELRDWEQHCFTEADNSKF